MPSPMFLQSVRKPKKAKGLSGFLRAWFVQSVPKLLKQKEMSWRDYVKDPWASVKGTPTPGQFA